MKLNIPIGKRCLQTFSIVKTIWKTRGIEVLFLLRFPSETKKTLLYSTLQSLLLKWESHVLHTQRQPSKSVLSKRYSENMQQSYRRTPMPKCVFNKIAKQLSWNGSSTLVFSCKSTAYFSNTFSQEYSWRAASARF